MSYILDALKRADAERERGHVPGLHTRSTPGPDAPPTRAGRIGTRGRLTALAVLLALGAVLWWWLRIPPAPLAVPAAAPAPPPPTASAASPPPSATAPPTEPVGDSNKTRKPPPPALPILAPAPPRAPARATAQPPAAPAVNTKRAPGEPPATKTAPETPDTSATGAPTTATPATPVRSFAELTPEARARLPAVNVSGSTYSKNPALRMLIVNGKVVQEGGEIAPGLTLETIEPRSAVLNHQGLRYRIGY